MDFADSSLDSKPPEQYLPICTLLVSTAAKVFAAIRNTVETELPVRPLGLGPAAHFEIQCYLLIPLYYFALVGKKGDAPELLRFCAGCVAAEGDEKFGQDTAWAVVQDRVQLYGRAFTLADKYPEFGSSKMQDEAVLSRGGLYKQGVAASQDLLCRILMDRGNANRLECYRPTSLIVHGAHKHFLIKLCISSAQDSYIAEFDHALAGVFMQPGDVREIPFENVVNGIKAGLERFALRKRGAQS